MNELKAYLMALIMVMMTLFIGPVFVEAANECNSYTVIDNVKRSTNYTVNLAKESPLCDLVWPTKWYRFQGRAGKEMPTKCPPKNSCGTTGPTWARGKMPENVGDTNKLKACVRFHSDCCAWSWDILAKKCEKNGAFYYVYKLRRTQGCSMAYCGGSERPCPPGLESANGYTPGCKTPPPKIIGSPTIKPGITNYARNNRLRFLCEFKSNNTDPSTIFEVTWYQESPVKQIGPTHLLQGAARSASLQNTHTGPREAVNFTLGRTIFCRVRTWYSQSPENKDSKTSNKYFAGIKIESDQLKFRITEKDRKPLKLTMKLTVPVVCQYGSYCPVKVALSQDGSTDLFTSCIFEFSPNRNGELTQEKSISVYGKRDFTNGGDRKMRVKYTVVSSTDPIDWNNHKEIPNIEISIGDVQTARCRSSSDPRIVTFDNRYYSHQQVGDYVLVNSSCRVFEVHARTWSCGYGTCNCGVAAREGDDVVIVDMCRDTNNPVPVARVASNGQLSHGASVKKDKSGRKFIINFPSGAYITFNARNTMKPWLFANIQVQVPSDDYYNCTTGLCGTFDSDASNDFTDKTGAINSWSGQNKFTESWKLPTRTSLFYHQGGKLKCRDNNVKHYCNCVERAGKIVSNCYHRTIADSGGYGSQGFEPIEFPPPAACRPRRRRKRRSASKDFSVPDDASSMSYVYDPAPLPEVNVSWPTTSGKTLSQVRIYCRDKIKKSQPGLVCQSIPDFDFQTYISQCIDDVQISDDYVFASSAVLTMQDACEEIFLKNVSYWQVDSAKNGSLGPPKAIAETLCPGLCSGNGQCVNATCICNSNYTSADCSIEKNKGPTVTSIPLNGLCDVRKRSDCEKIRVNGRDFLDSDKLSCRSQHLKVSEKPYKKLSKTDTSRGYMLSYAQTMCQLEDNPVKTAGDPINTKSTPNVGYLLDVSNDGKVFSSGSPLYLIYDSKCKNCSAVTGICVSKPNTCIINGYCFLKGERNPTNICMICDPSLNATAFTSKSSCFVSSPSISATSSYPVSSFVTLSKTLAIHSTSATVHSASKGSSFTTPSKNLKIHSTFATVHSASKGIMRKGSSFVTSSKTLKVHSTSATVHSATKGHVTSSKTTLAISASSFVTPTASVSTSPGCQGSNCPGPDNKGNNDKKAMGRKSNVIVIVGSVFGGIIALLIVAAIVMKAKKAQTFKHKIDLVYLDVQEVDANKPTPQLRENTFTNVAFESDAN